MVFIVNHVLKVLIVPNVPFYNENRILKCEEYIIEKLLRPDTLSVRQLR
jgi:hypothetical protein